MRSFALSILAVLALGVVACRQEGAAERAGRKIDEAVESTSEAVQGAADDAKQAAQEAEEKAKKAVE